MMSDKPSFEESAHPRAPPVAGIYHSPLRFLTRLHARLLLSHHKTDTMGQSDYSNRNDQ